MLKPIRILWLWVPPIAWAAFIFLESSSATPPVRPPGPDYVLHAIAFGILGLLSARAFGGGFRHAAETARRYAVRAALLGALCAALYGIGDEIHQMFVPGRTPEVKDALADTAGALMGVAALLVLRRIVRRVLPGLLPAGSPAAVSCVPRVLLLSRQGCHLCDEAHELLESERQLRPFELVIHDIDARDFDVPGIDVPGIDGRAGELSSRFGEEVPVVFIDGKKRFKYRVDRERLRALLDASRREKLPQAPMRGHRETA